MQPTKYKVGVEFQCLHGVLSLAFNASDHEVPKVEPYNLKERHQNRIVSEGVAQSG